MSKAVSLIRFRYAALSVGIVLLVLALIAFLVAAHSRTVVAQNTWSNIGAVLATTALVGIIYDSLLKPRMLTEIRSSLELDASGVTAIAPSEDLLISRWPPRHRDVLVIVPDLRDWLKRGDWLYLCDLARRSSVALRLYGSIDDSIEAQLPTMIGDDWNRRGPSGEEAMQRDSSIVVYTLPKESQVSIYRSGDAAIVGVDAPFAEYVWGSAMGLQMTSSKSELWDWILSVETRVAKFATECCRFPADRGVWN